MRPAVQRPCSAAGRVDARVVDGHHHDVVRRRSRAADVEAHVDAREVEAPQAVCGEQDQSAGRAEERRAQQQERSQTPRPPVDAPTRAQLVQQPVDPRVIDRCGRDHQSEHRRRPCRERRHDPDHDALAERDVRAGEEEHDRDQAGEDPARGAEPECDERADGREQQHEHRVDPAPGHVQGEPVERGRDRGGLELGARHLVSDGRPLEVAQQVGGRADDDDLVAYGARIEVAGLDRRRSSAAGSCRAVPGSR